MAILYDIRLRVLYSFDSPAGHSRTVLRLQPRPSAGQQVIAGAVTCDPQPDLRQDHLDFWGNPVTVMAHARTLHQRVFQFHGRVRRQDAAPALDLSADLRHLPDDIATIRSVSAEAPHHFLGASPRVAPDDAIGAFARQAAQGQSVRDVVCAVARAVQDEMAFDPQATDVSTPPAQAFQARRGVCQDFSHITIAALRSLGIPAGYVSGFLRTDPPPGQARLEGADAMHAWVQAWCGAEAGWLQIDPTNAMLAGRDHIEVARGRDYDDVAPVRGSVRVAGGHVTRHEVDVIPVKA